MKSLFKPLSDSIWRLVRVSPAFLLLVVFTYLIFRYGAGMTPERASVAGSVPLLVLLFINRILLATGQDQKSPIETGHPRSISRRVLAVIMIAGFGFAATITAILCAPVYWFIGMAEPALMSLQIAGVMFMVGLNTCTLAIVLFYWKPIANITRLGAGLLIRKGFMVPTVIANTLRISHSGHS